MRQAIKAPIYAFLILVVAVVLVGLLVRAIQSTERPIHINEEILIKENRLLELQIENKRLTKQLKE